MYNAHSLINNIKSDIIPDDKFDLNMSNIKSNDD